MSADFLLKVATVLEAVADQVESQVAVKTAAVKEARDANLRDLAERYNAATGEELDVAKLASFGEAELETVKQLVEKTAGATVSVESMGGPGEPVAGRPTPRNKKEAVAASNEKFANWIVNG
jgi:hypothetical protein